MTRAHFLADTAAVLLCLAVLCLAMPAHAGCEAPKPKSVTVYKPKPQQVCTCRPMQQARKVVKRAMAKPVAPVQPACPEPAPTREAVSTPGAGGGGGLRLVPFTLPEPVNLAQKPQEPITLSQATQVPDAGQSWRGGPIWMPAGPFVSVAPPVALPVVVPGVPEPHGLALFGVGLVVVISLIRGKKCLSMTK